MLHLPAEGQAATTRGLGLQRDCLWVRSWFRGSTVNSADKGTLFPWRTESYYCTHKCPTPERDEITQLNPRTSSARNCTDISDRSCLLAEKTPHGSNWAVFTDEKGLALSVEMVFDIWLPLLAMTDSSCGLWGSWLFCTLPCSPSVRSCMHLKTNQTDIRYLPKIYPFQQAQTSHWQRSMKKLLLCWNVSRNTHT